MTLEELEATLPWGLHDAHVERLAIDWTRAQLTRQCLGVQRDEAATAIDGHPAKPDGCIRHRFFVSDFNSFEAPE